MHEKVIATVKLYCGLTTITFTDASKSL